jgi:hypothetical protein
LSLVQQWLDACHSSHPQCKLTIGSQTRKFFRILDVGATEDFRDLRLCEADELSNEAAYMTLSHCWGSLKIMTLTTENHQALKNRIQFDGLPKTFQDAIIVTRSLGIQYLWIDSLCIIQDSEEDWRLQARDMGDIYRYSWCNIAATAARDGRDGLFRYSKRNPAYLKHLKVRIADAGQPQVEGVEPEDYWEMFHPNERTIWQGMAVGYYDCIDRELWVREVSQSPLGRRAWVVQERLLAPRVVHFGADQLFWECNTLKACELYPKGLPEVADLLSSAELKSPDITSGYSYPKNFATQEDWNDIDSCPRILKCWYDVVQLYSDTELSFEHDKLVAIAGLVNNFAGRINAKYLAGLWGVHLPRQLLWSTRVPIARPEQSRAPSWSWASVDGGVKGVVDVDNVVQRSLIKILDVSTEGDILQFTGRLCLQARLIPCKLSFDPSARADKRCNPSVRGLDYAAYVKPDTSGMRYDVSSNIPVSFFCVPIMIFFDATEPTTPEVAGLVVEATESKGIFRRFGAFRTDNAMDRDGDRHPDWVYNLHVQPREHTQFGRVFLMEVEDEQSEVGEQFYQFYENDLQRKSFGNFTFTVV